MVAVTIISNLINFNQWYRNKQTKMGSFLFFFLIGNHPNHYNHWRSNLIESISIFPLFEILPFIWLLFGWTPLPHKQLIRIKSIWQKWNWYWEITIIEPMMMMMLAIVCCLWNLSNNISVFWFFIISKNNRFHSYRYGGRAKKKKQKNLHLKRRKWSDCPDRNWDQSRSRFFDWPAHLNGQSSDSRNRSPKRVKLIEEEKMQQKIVSKNKPTKLFVFSKA